MEQKKKNKNKGQISVILTEENFRKMQEVTKNMAMTITEYVNYACSGVSIIGLAETKGILKEFVKIRIALENGVLSEEDREAGEKVCQCLHTLTKQISSLEI